MQIIDDYRKLKDSRENFVAYSVFTTTILLVLTVIGLIEVGFSWGVDHIKYDIEHSGYSIDYHESGTNHYYIIERKIK